MILQLSCHLGVGLLFKFALAAVKIISDQVTNMFTALISTRALLRPRPLLNPPGPLTNRASTHQMATLIESQSGLAFLREFLTKARWRLEVCGYWFGSNEAPGDENDQI